MPSLSRVSLVVATLAFTPTLLPAQSPSNLSSRPMGDAADSAAQARATYRAAVLTLRAGDSVEALKGLRTAALTWPQQPFYANALLQLATSRRDTTEIRRAVVMGNAIGMPLAATVATNAMAFTTSRAPSAPSSATSRTAQSAATTSVDREPLAIHALLAVQDSLRAPHPQSGVLRMLNDSLLFPEGVSADVRTGVLYVSSLRRRNVLVVAPGGAEHVLLPPTTRGIGAIFGVVTDTSRNVVWAVSVASPLAQPGTSGDSTVTSLLAIRMSDGAVVERIPFPASDAAASPGDIALTPTGDVLIADSQNGILWRLARNAKQLTAIRHHLFRSLQGIVPAKSGSVVWVADYSIGLLRVDVGTGEAVRVADLTGHTTVGIDGLVRYGNTFVGVQNGNMPAQVVQLTLNAAGTRVLQHNVVDRNAMALSPTGGTILNNDLVYVANSLWDYVDSNGVLRLNSAFPRPILLSLRLH